MGSAFSRWISASTSSSTISAGRRCCQDRTPHSSQAFSLLRTYTAYAGTLPTRTTARPGRPPAAASALTGRASPFSDDGPAPCHRSIGPAAQAVSASCGEDYRLGAVHQHTIFHVHLLRTGITGELGYELHGSADDAAQVWQDVVDEGRAFGIRELGVRSQLISHIEAGIASNGSMRPSSMRAPWPSRWTCPASSGSATTRCCSPGAKWASRRRGSTAPTCEG